MENTHSCRVLHGRRRKNLSLAGLKIFVILLCPVWGTVLASPLPVQQQKVSVSYRNVPLVRVLDDLKGKTGYHFFYFDGIIPESLTVDVSLNMATISEILDAVLSDNGFTYEIENNIVSVGKAQQQPQPQQQRQQQSLQLRGKVVDAGGKPISGATVMVKGTKHAVATDANGNFTIVISPPKDSVLSVSFLGKLPVEVSCKNRETISITMKDAVTSIEEVVITGIFNKPKESFTGAARMVTSEELAMSGSRSVITALRNLDPSFNIADNISFGSDPNRLPAITMRGTTSISDEYRDIGSEASNFNQANQPLFILDGFEITLEQFMDMDESTIDNITLLKDASSTAIYGSRGANGVVVITRIKPQPGKVRLSYTSDLSIEAPNLSSYDLMNASEKLEFEKLSGIYTSSNPLDQAKLDEIYNNRKIAIENGADTYWLKYPVRTGVSLNHSLSVSGGSDLQYTARVSYRQIKGVMKGSERDNLNNSLFLSYRLDKLSINNSLVISTTESRNSPYGNFYEYATKNPYLIPYDENGNPIKILEGSEVSILNKGEKVTNPLYDASLPSKDESKSIYISESLSMVYTPVKDLRLTGRFNVTHSNSRSDKYLSYRHSSFDSYLESEFDQKGSYTYSTGVSNSVSADATAQYSLFLGKHNINAGLSGSISDSRSENYSIYAVGLTSDKANYLGMATAYGSSRPVSSDSKQRRVGAIATLNYVFDRRLYVDFSGVKEGSSMFGSNQKFATFWTAGVGWNLHNESLFESWFDNDYLNNLRLRFSYGSSGSQGFQSYQSETTYVLIEGKGYNQQYGVKLYSIGNPDLKWQITKQTNYGFEVGILDDRIRFEADYYVKITDDLLTNIYLPTASGFEYYLANIGKVRNEGYQMSLYLSPMRSSDSKNFYMSLGLSAIHNTNKVLEISNSIDFLNDQIRDGTTVNPSFMYKEGESMNTIFAVKSLGIDPSNGKEIFVRQDGTLTYYWDSDDLVPCGVTDPTMTGNISLNLRYRNFSLSSIIGYGFGGMTYNSTLADKVENVSPYTNADRRVLYERWKEPGDQVFFKGFGNSETTYATSRFVMKNNWMDFRSLTLSYRVNSDWLSRNLRVSGLNLHASTEDIFRIASIKQERGTSYPYSKKYSFSLTVTF